MRPMDMPPRRPLGKDQDRSREPAGPAASDRPGAGDRAGWPDGRERSPAELLDNLRLRLSELADNHPSHPGSPRAASRPDRAESLAEPQPDSQAGEWTEAGDWAKAAEQPEREDRARSDDRADASSDVRPGWIAEAIRAARLDDGLAALTGGMLAALDLPGTGGYGDPYRPWFMAGEPGSPWWAAADELWD